jgi:hypothetical protein
MTSDLIQVIGIVDYDASPFGIWNVAVLLPIVSVGLVEKYFVTALRQSTKNSTVVSSRAVPIGRDET